MSRCTDKGLKAIVTVLILTLCSTVWVSCFLDKPTAPGQDLASLEFSISGDSVVLLGGMLQLTPEMPVGSGRGPSQVTWTSSDTTIAAVDSLGVVTGVAIGSTEITASVIAPDIVTEVVRSLDVEVVYAAIGIEPIDSLTGLGETRILEVHGLALDESRHAELPAVFSCPDSDVAVVTPSGVLTARGNGIATVTATYGEYTTNVAITVRQVAKRLSFAVPRIDLPELNHDTTIAVDVHDTRDSVIVSPSLVWSSSDTTAITVTGSGVIRAISSNPAYVMARSDTVEAQLPVAVEQGVTALLIHEGDNQIVAVGTAVAVAPAVIALDDGGNPMGGVWVTFEITSGGGQITGATQLTNAQGIARVGSWTLGTNAGANSITATAEGRTNTINATAIPGPLSLLVSHTVVSSDTIGIGDDALLTLYATDEYDNLISNGSFNVLFAATGGTSTGLIGGATDNADGTYTATFTGVTAGTATLINTSIDGAAVMSPRPTITVAALPAELIMIAGDNQTAAAGATLPIDPAVQVNDGAGNPIQGVVVTFSVAQGGGTITDSVHTTDEKGSATLGSWTVGTVAGPNALTVVGGGLSTGASATAVAGPADPAMSLVTISQDTVAAGSGATFSIELRDAYGNSHTSGGAVVTFSLASGSSNGSIGAVTDNNDGMYDAPFTGERAGTPARVDATIDGSAVTSTRPSVTVVAGPVESVTPQAGDNQTTTVGVRVPLPPAVTVLDSYGNPVPAATVSFTPSGGGTAIGSPVTTDSAGVAALIGWALGTTAGPYSLTASVSGQQHVFAATATVPAVLDTVVPGNLLLGTGPSRVAVSEISDLAYVTNRSSDYVTVIDVLGDSALSTITVGGKPVGVAVHAVTDRVYVSSEVTNVLTVIDGGTHAIITAVALGETPAGVAIDENQDLVYVALPGSNRLFVIDAATNTVTDTIAVGANPQWLAADAANKRLWVSNTNDGTVTVIESDKAMVRTTIDVGVAPHGIAAVPGEKRAVVATRDAVIEIDENTVKETYALPAGAYRGIAMGTNIYIADSSTSQLLTMNRASGTVISALPVGDGAMGVGLHSGTGRVYAASSLDNSVTVVRNDILATVIARVGGQRGLVVHEGLNYVFVANGISDNVSVIDATTHAVVGAAISVGSSPWDIAASEAANKVWVANSGDNTVSVIDASTRSVIGTIGVGTAPRGVAVNQSTGRVYVANYDDNTVSVIEGATNVVVATVAVGANPTAVVVDTMANLIYVSHENDDVSVIDGTTNAVTGSIGPLGGNPSDIGWNGVTGKLYVPNNISPGTIWTIDATTSSVTGSSAVVGIPAVVCVDAARDLVMVPSSTAIQYVNGTTGSVVYTMFVATTSLGVDLNRNTNKVFLADRAANVNGIIILQN